MGGENLFGLGEALRRFVPFERDGFSQFHAVKQRRHGVVEGLRVREVTIGVLERILHLGEAARPVRFGEPFFATRAVAIGKIPLFAASGLEAVPLRLIQFLLRFIEIPFSHLDQSEAEMRIG